MIDKEKLDKLSNNNYIGYFLIIFGILIIGQCL